MPADRPAFSLTLRVYWEDTDAGGVVYHASYVRFLERARTEWLRAAGYDQTTLRGEGGLLLVVRAMRLDFLGPARLDDLLTVTVTPVEAKGASLRCRQSVLLGERPLLTAEVEVACLRAADFRPTRIPAGLLADLMPNPGAPC
ncbi:tol-pal system-associated acyl-CoA thioesterase [Silanimonas sp.]|jgi:acyl-CoA thioester hydrolase|uniref:tol-pal system-associated acyl-CoA thioesterase n=1 Tax=Silanimonas sp. TaxID=1929290 RepID=UPI0037C93F68